jgi:hypothetical protein
MGQSGVGGHSRKSALQLTNVVRYDAGDELEDVSGHWTRRELGVATENGETSFDIGRLDIRQESPLESAAKAVFEGREIAGMAIGTDHHLLAEVVEAVEGVKELLEDLLFALEELDVIEQENISRPIAVLEVVNPLPPDRVDEVVQETLGCDVTNNQAGVKLEGEMPDCMKEVGLAQAGRPVDE